MRAKGFRGDQYKGGTQEELVENFIPI